MFFTFTQLDLSSVTPVGLIYVKDKIVVLSRIDMLSLPVVFPLLVRSTIVIHKSYPASLLQTLVSIERPSRFTIFDGAIIFELKLLILSSMSIPQMNVSSVIGFFSCAIKDFTRSWVYDIVVLWVCHLLFIIMIKLKDSLNMLCVTFFS